ncbi:MAG: polynucleotide adenylyltransferase PcnB [Gammaproteobacteria bacterium]|nr:polynucleotide adenylyltransferase PcnB [Gammaproteobacteria bacterium]MCY4227810.1 polynucleotide adenylyltransferase PcnB [Gammaproteobacteria bacterium]
MEAEYYRSHELGFGQSDISPDSLETVRNLKSHGYDGLLVGGCVRDLILGLKPKDFDVATDALPNQVCKIFPRSRIIGRRFKIVHVRQRGRRYMDYIEVTTYRANPESSGSWMSRVFPKYGKKRRALHGENIYGAREEDVMRRDFTINSLYYDPVEEQVIDYLGGIRDIQQQQLRMIGNPQQRFLEDPARIIRAIRFKAKLGFDLECEMEEEIQQHAAWVEGLNSSRLYDEVIKFFNQGAAEESWDQIFKTPLGKMLFSHVASGCKGSSSDSFKSFVRQALRNTDRRVREGLPVIDSFFISVVFWNEYQQSLLRYRAKGLRAYDAHDSAVSDCLVKSPELLVIPLRVRDIVQEIWRMQARLERRHKRDIGAIMTDRRFRAAYDFLALRSKVGEIDLACAKWWTEIQKANSKKRMSMIDQLPDSGKTRSKRKGRKNRSDRQHEQSPATQPQDRM